MSTFQLRQNGWAAIDAARNDQTLLDLAATYGRPIPAKGGRLISKLRPTLQSQAAPSTFASVHGPKAYPLHTDTAFLPTRHDTSFSPRLATCVAALHFVHGTHFLSHFQTQNFAVSNHPFGWLRLRGNRFFVRYALAAVMKLVTGLTHSQ